MSETRKSFLHRYWKPALADALRNGSLNPTQTEIVRALREGLGLLGEKNIEDVKVQSLNTTEVFAYSEIS